MQALNEVKGRILDDDRYVVTINSNSLFIVSLQHYISIGNPKKRSGWSTEKDGGNRHCYGRSRDGVTTILTSIYCLFINVFYTGVIKPGIYIIDIV